MKSIIEKNWITFLGVGFIFLAFIYFLKLAIDLGWMPPGARAATGIVLGISGLFAAYTLYAKKQKLSAETIGGLGTGILYATIAYGSFSEHIQWSTNLMGIATIGISSVLGVISYKFNMRILALISIIGGLLTPLIIKASPEQDFLLFIYIFVINAVGLYISALKSWREIRVVTFFSTLAIYISYYILFEPEYWTKPFTYISAFYFVYLIGLILSSWKEHNRFDGINLYLGLLNAVNYVFWSIYIFNSFEIPYVIPVLVVGMSFIVASMMIYRMNHSALLASGTYMILGLIVIALSVSDIGLLLDTPGLHYAVNAATWLIIACSIFLIGQFFNHDILKNAGMIAWVLITIFWYIVAWDVEWIRWFGVAYIPFLNPGALVWIGLALAGFYYSKALSKYEGDVDRENYSMAFAIASLFVIGGLFTVQIQNLWDAYHIQRINMELTLSCMYMLFALIIFAWGAYSRKVAFRYMGSIVIGITSLKVFVSDLDGQSSTYKILALLCIGLIALLIGYLNNRWGKIEETEISNLKSDQTNLS